MRKKVTTVKFKAFIIFMCINFFLTSSLFASSGFRNGDDDPALAYEDVDVNNLDFNNLDFLKVDAKTIKKRETKLNKILKKAYELNISNVVNELEDNYGLDFYHYKSTSHGYYDPHLKNKAGIMDAAIRFYCGCSNSPLWDVDSRFLSGKDFVYSDYCRDFSYRTWKEVADYYIIFALIPTSTSKVYTSTRQPLFEDSRYIDFLQVMKDSNLNGLDATIVFLNSSKARNGCNEGDLYTVVYPDFSELAPIPQPIVFIYKDATYDDMSKMLEENAPLIYAYNELFDKNILPAVSELTASLEKYPDIIDEVKDLQGTVARENMREAVKRTFLRVSFGLLAVGAAPVALSVLLASALLRPVFFTQLNTQILIVN